MTYILNKNIALRSWWRVPYAYYRKGVRDAQDSTYEINMARMNSFIHKNFETVLLPASPELSFLSSTFVRDLIRYEKPLDGALHPDAVAYVSVI